MPASDSDLRALQPRERKYKFSCGNALFVEVYPGGGKYFVWKYYFPPGRKGQQRWYQIGPLDEAQEGAIRISTGASVTNLDQLWISKVFAPELFTNKYGSAKVTHPAQ